MTDIRALAGLKIHEVGLKTKLDFAAKVLGTPRFHRTLLDIDVLVGRLAHFARETSRVGGENGVPAYAELVERTEQFLREYKADAAHYPADLNGVLLEELRYDVSEMLEWMTRWFEDPAKASVEWAEHEQRIAAERKVQES